MPEEFVWVHETWAAFEALKLLPDGHLDAGERDEEEGWLTRLVHSVQGEQVGFCRAIFRAPPTPLWRCSCESSGCTLLEIWCSC